MATETFFRVQKWEFSGVFTLPNPNNSEILTAGLCLGKSQVTDGVSTNNPQGDGAAGCYQQSDDWNAWTPCPRLQQPAKDYTSAPAQGDQY